MSEWSHLPNAAHIDRVLAHAKANLYKWAAARDAALDATWDAAMAAGRVPAWHAAWDAAMAAARGAAWKAAWGAAGDAALGATWDAAWGSAGDAARDVGAAREIARDACAALIAWDEAGGLLSAPVATVRFLAQEGVHAAVLLLPAAIAMEVTNE